MLSEVQVESLFKQKKDYKVKVSEENEHKQLVGALSRFRGKIIMVRHGPTDFSESRLFAGGVSLENADLFAQRIGEGQTLSESEYLPEDIRLSDNGLHMTELYALSDEGIALRDFAQTSLCVVSPLCRAQSTADMLLGPMIPRRVHAGLNERYLGDEFGIEAGEPSQVKLDDPHYVFLGGGESGGQYAERVLSTLLELVDAASKSEKNLLIVGHSHWIKVALAGLIALSGEKVRLGFWNEKVEPCAPIVISEPMKDGARSIFEFMFDVAMQEAEKGLSDMRFPAGEDASGDRVQQSRSAEFSRVSSRRQGPRRFVR